MLPSHLILPVPPNISFEGFSPEALKLLDALREHPHVEQYRKLKADLDRSLIRPFKQYRDDLVLNYVLPNELPMETERNVFSRLLKNDFGAGGCHHHLWLSFYRKDRTRLTDLQFTHSISPDGLSIGIYAGDHARDILAHVKSRISEETEHFLNLLKLVLAQQDWSLNYYIRKGASETAFCLGEPVTQIPDDLSRASGIWIHTDFPREQVILWQGEFVEHSLRAVKQLWPLYRFLL